jgi:hypothetical protein
MFIFKVTVTSANGYNFEIFTSGIRVGVLEAAASSSDYVVELVFNANFSDIIIRRESVVKAMLYNMLQTNFDISITSELNLNEGSVILSYLTNTPNIDQIVEKLFLLDSSLLISGLEDFQSASIDGVQQNDPRTGGTTVATTTPSSKNDKYKIVTIILAAT